MTTTNQLAVRLIRKYRNRKFYDSASHSYVTLQDIFSYYNSGDNVKVVDKDERDITDTTLMDSVILAKKNDQKFREALLKLGRQA